MDFVGRFEKLAQDSGYFSDVISISDTHLAKLVVGDGRSYTKAYDEEEAIVAEHYQGEIDYFGFEFGE